MLGRSSWPIRVDPDLWVVFIGPEDAGPGPPIDEPLVLGEEWKLVHPQVPDYPPDEEGVRPAGS